jgi:hypothetical protein
MHLLIIDGIVDLDLALMPHGDGKKYQNSNNNYCFPFPTVL